MSRAQCPPGPPPTPGYNALIGGRALPGFARGAPGGRALLRFARGAGRDRGLPRFVCDAQRSRALPSLFVRPLRQLQDERLQPAHIKFQRGIVFGFRAARLLEFGIRLRPPFLSIQNYPAPK